MSGGVRVRAKIGEGEVMGMRGWFAAVWISDVDEDEVNPAAHRIPDFISGPHPSFLAAQNDVRERAESLQEPGIEVYDLKGAAKA